MNLDDLLPGLRLTLEIAERSADWLNVHEEGMRQIDAVKSLIDQRDELLSALKQIEALPSELAGDAWAIARAAIAKAEG